MCGESPIIQDKFAQNQKNYKKKLDNIMILRLEQNIYDGLRSPLN